jgi:hypothetical protein
MLKFNNVCKSALTLGLFVATSFAYADSLSSQLPVPVSQYVYDPSVQVVEDAGEMTVDQVASYLQRKSEDESAWLGTASGESLRIRNLDPTQDAGKVIIKVHKSEDPKVVEYLEVFRQNSANPNDLSPLNLFDNQTSNRALVSRAGFYNVKKYTTPSGDFALDRFEKMHHSSAYNDAPMPFTMFFNQGIAIHAATPSEYKNLGREASHGCVRTHLETARELFAYLNPSMADGKANASVVVEVMDN